MKRIFAFVTIFMCIVQYAKADIWLYDFEEAKKEALANNKLILVDFWASWSDPCKKMELESWSKDDVKELMQKYVPLKIDIDENKSLANKYRVMAVPFVSIMDANGRVLYKKMGYKNTDEIVQLLKKYAVSTELLTPQLTGFYKKESFVTSYKLALKYQDFSMQLEDGLKKDFLDMSDNYFNESLNYLSSSSLQNKAAFRQKIQLLKIQKDIILGKPIEAHQKLKTLKRAQIDKINVSLFSFLNHVSLSLLKRYEQAEPWLKEVNSTDKKRMSLFLPKKDKSVSPKKE